MEETNVKKNKEKKRKKKNIFVQNSSANYVQKLSMFE